MAYEKNDVEYGAGAPKKADIIIKSTQDIALRQEELSEQTRLAVSRINDAIEMFSKNNNDAQYIVKQSGEIFEQLQSENSVLKQELLYLAKQSENIYAGLAEKITELSETAKNRESTLEALSDKLNDVAAQALNGDNSYLGIVDKINALAEQNRRTETLFNAVNEKLNVLSEKMSAISSQPVKTVEKELRPVEVDNSEILNKLTYITEQLRRSEGAHSMLADKFEILSMRVEQFGFESAKGAPAGYNHTTVTPVAYPAATTVVKSEEIDYDKLAAKIADLISAREVISPDYIASKVAEQIVVPEPENVRVRVDEHAIAGKVAELIGGRSSENAPIVNTAVNIDEEALAERIAAKIGNVPVQSENAPVVNTAVNIDEEALAERIAQKIGSVNVNAASAISIDEEELADAIALKVGSLKSEDFEILVDDDGCSSISKEIANKLDYNVISNVIADKLRDTLDLMSANAPDYEEMAERISEKITVAGINEDAIADKAAAVLSNYLPDFDTDEIADKVTGAVIDVVSAMPQPTLDNETICNNISERLIQSQEDHDYDIVIDDDGIEKITALITEQIENQTGARLDKVEEALTGLTEQLTAKEVAEEVAEEAEAEAAVTEATEVQEGEEIAIDDYAQLSELVAAEIEKGTSTRFDKVEEKITKLSELVSSAVSGSDYEEYEEIIEDPDYNEYSGLSKDIITRLGSVEDKINNLTDLLSVEQDEVEEVETDDVSLITEAIAAEIETSVTSRLDSVEEKINSISELLTAEEEEPAEELDGEQPEEDDIAVLTEAFAAELEKSVTSRLDSVEEKINTLTEMMSPEEEAYDELEEAEEETEVVEEDYTDLSAAVADEIERRVASRFDSVEEKIAGLTELITPEEEVYDELEEEAAETEEYEEDYTKLSEAVADEIDRRITARIDSLEENVAKITLMVASGVDVQSDDANLREVVAAEIEKGLGGRFDKVEEDIAKITEYVEGDIPVETDGRLDKIAEDVARISTFIEGEYSVETDARLDKILSDLQNITEALEAPADGGEERIAGVEQGITEIKELLSSGVTVAENELAEPSAIEQSLAEIKELLSNGVTVAEGEPVNNEAIEQSLAEIKELLSNGVTVAESEPVNNEAIEQSLAEIKELLSSGVTVAESEPVNNEAIEQSLAEIKELLSNGVPVTENAPANVSDIENSLAEIKQLLTETQPNTSDKNNDALEEIKQLLRNGAFVAAAEQNAETRVEDVLSDIKEMLASGIVVTNEKTAETEDYSVSRVEDTLAEIKEMLAGGIVVAGAGQEAEAAPALAEAPAPAAEEEEQLVTVSDLVEPSDISDDEDESLSGLSDPAEEEEEEDDGDDDDFLIDVLDMDRFSDDELMPGEISEFGDVDFANMMKFKRSFIARIIQSSDENKQYYGEVKHALLSYRKVNSNVAWGAERFNKGRETIARMKIRGKTLCLYLALDPNNYKTSVYHHLDVSDNKSVAGTPMMVKVKSGLGVRKAIRLIDEMLAARNGEKREIPERDYAAMYPYETIEELIDDGLVKDVRKK